MDEPTTVIMSFASAEPTIVWDSRRPDYLRCRLEVVVCKERRVSTP